MIIMIKKGDGLRRVPRGESGQLGGFKLVPQFQSWNGDFIIIINMIINMVINMMIIIAVIIIIS